MNRKPAIIILLFISILIVSCTPKLVGMPEESGLIVFEGEYIHFGGISIKDIELYFSDLPIDIKGKQIGKYIIFDNLKPGLYKIRKLTGYAPDGASATTARKIEIKVEENTPIYIGKYILDPDAIDYLTLDSSPEYEAQAWKFFLRLYKDSPWSKIIREREKIRE